MDSNLLVLCGDQGIYIFNICIDFYIGPWIAFWDLCSQPCFTEIKLTRAFVGLIFLITLLAPLRMEHMLHTF